jgi:hypothetical protein
LLQQSSSGSHNTNNNNTVEKERKRRRAREGQTFSFVSALLSSGKEMIEKLTVLIVITTRKAEVPFAYVCVYVGKGERESRAKKKRDDENERRIKKKQHGTFPPLSS